MKPLLNVTTAISLVFSLSAAFISAESHASQQSMRTSSAYYMPNSPYQERRMQQARPVLRTAPSQPAPMPVEDASAVPFGRVIASDAGSAQPYQIASADMASPHTLMPADAMAPSPSLIPVLPRASLSAMRPLYPSKVGTKPAVQAQVLPLPQDIPPAVPAPEAAPAADAAPQALMAPIPAESGNSLPSSQAALPAVLPLPDEMPAAGAPVFKPYATIETQTGSVPEHAAGSETTRDEALRKLKEAEDYADSMTPSAPAQPAAVDASKSVAASDVPAVLPLPDDMAAQKSAAEGAPDERAAKRFLTAPQSVAGKELSERTKQTLAKIPAGVDTPKPQRGGKIGIDRFDPEVKGLLDAQKDKEAAKEEVASMEGEGVSIKVRRPAVNADAELERAYKALLAGNSDAAIESYKEVAVAYPTNETALFGLAATYHRMGRTEEAKVYYDKLLQINPDHRDALNNFLVLMADESPDEALHQMQILERKNPDFSPIPAQMAIIYSKMGNPDAARGKMLRAIELSPDNLAYQYNLAIMMDQQGHYPEAAGLYRKLIAASQAGKEIPTDVSEIEHRLVYIDTVRHD